jgi:hypothetical protein
VQPAQEMTRSPKRSARFQKSRRMCAELNGRLYLSSATSDVEGLVRAGLVGLDENFLAQLVCVKVKSNGDIPRHN